MPGAYALFLLVSIMGLGALDYRYSLAVFHKPRRALSLLAAAVSVFIAWDAAGIAAGIFRIGENSLLIGMHLGEFPLEELLFLALLNYTSLTIYSGLRKVLT